MILSYEEAIKEYGSDYKLKKAIDSGVVFKIENGIYSSRKYNNELEVILKKYPSLMQMIPYSLSSRAVLSRKEKTPGWETWGNEVENDLELAA